MFEISLADIDRTIAVLKLRALEQARELANLGSNPYTEELRPVHARLVQNIYRITCIRDGLITNKPCTGEYLH